MSYPFRNLVFEGGGVKGIAYVGALRELGKKKILPDIERVGGASAGAINAVLLALGYSLPEMERILSTLDFKSFMDDTWGVVRDTKRLIKKYGWYKGDFFREWIGDLIQKKTGNRYSTFNDLHKGGSLDLYVVGVNLSTGFAEVFSNEHTPRERVADAVRVSMSIPLFFAAIRDDRGDVFVDGGLLANYPVKLFDREKYIDQPGRKAYARQTDYYEADNKLKPESSSPYVYNKQTLGFRLDSRQEIAMFRDGAEPPHRQIDHFFGYTVALFEGIWNAQNNEHLHNDDWHRTIYIDTIGVNTTDFDLSDAKKKALVQEGVKGVREYFAWYDKNDPNDAPINR